MLTGCPLAIPPDWQDTLADWKDTLEDLFVDDSSRQVTLADLFIDDGTGPKPYLDVMGPSPDPKFVDLPLGRVAIAYIGDEVGWMRAFDFNKNQTLEEGEMTQAWLAMVVGLQRHNFGPR